MFILLGTPKNKMNIPSTATAAEEQNGGRLMPGIGAPAILRLAS
jgi:hypothetical protein